MKANFVGSEWVCRTHWMGYDKMKMEHAFTLYDSLYFWIFSSVIQRILILVFLLSKILVSGSEHWVFSFNFIIHKLQWKPKNSCWNIYFVLCLILHTISLFRTYSSSIVAFIAKEWGTGLQKYWFDGLRAITNYTVVAISLSDFCWLPLYVSLKIQGVESKHFIHAYLLRKMLVSYEIYIYKNKLRK